MGPVVLVFGGKMLLGALGENLQLGQPSHKHIGRWVCLSMGRTIHKHLLGICEWGARVTNTTAFMNGAPDW